MLAFVEGASQPNEALVLIPILRGEAGNRVPQNGSGVAS